MDYKPDCYKFNLQKNNDRFSLLPIDFNMEDMSERKKLELKRLVKDLIVDKSDQESNCPVIEIIIYRIPDDNSTIMPCVEVLEAYSDSSLQDEARLLKIHPAIHFVCSRFNKEEKFARSYLYMDSSIWNYGVLQILGDGGEVCQLTSGLNDCLVQIYENWEKGYYDISNAREYVDLNARIVKESRLYGTHSDVSPFVFHSESQTMEALRRILKDAYCMGHQWRMLLVDDHSMGKLTNINKAAVNDLTKTSIIIDRLKSINLDGKSVKVKYKSAKEDCWEGDNDCDIAIEYVETVGDFFLHVFGDGNRVSPKRYDIILLDYRLENDYSYRIFSILKNLIALKNKLKEGNSVADCISEINHADIIYLVDSNTIKINNSLEIPCERFVDWLEGGIGPAERLYFMFISSYTYAIQERLEEQGISRSEKYWYIGRGACPINTPSLFLYHLYSIMKKRVDTLLGDLKPAHLFFKENMFVGKEDSGLLDVGKCRQAFPDMLRLKSVYEIALKDCLNEDNGIDGFTSPLCRSVFGDVSSLTPEFWESMRHLSYMISYYSSEHWPEMWTEFLSAKQALDEKNMLNEDWTQILEVIRKHILSLADKY